MNSLIILIIFAVFSSCACSDVNVVANENDDVDLQDLSDEELEGICTTRGFELVKEVDEKTGQPRNYSHGDYVDAARQCLQIEAEMEGILSENPDLMDDIESETQKMLEEKKRLEAELAEAQLKLKKEKEGNLANKSSSDKVDRSSFDGNTTVGFGGDTQSENNSITTSGGDDEVDEVIDLDEDTKVNDQVIDKVQLASDDARGGIKNEESSGVKEDGPEKKVSIMTTEEFLKEFKNEIRESIARVVDIMKPLTEALRPVIRISKNTTLATFDLLKRNILAIFKTATDKLAEQQKGEVGEESITNK